MIRNVQHLAANEYDVAIVGGGIYGISTARDAALRGLRVALIDRGDFGHATSANHHKIIHGGFRYLQHAHFKRMRESICERSTLLRIAPHLVHLLPVLIPTCKRMLQRKLLLSLALKVNDLISFDRNRRLNTSKVIPRGRTISKSELVRLCPGLDTSDVTGGAIFFDAQVINPNRLNLATLVSAIQAGAHAVNYVDATGLLRQGNQITGIHVRDMFRMNTLTLRARVVVNCAGPWVDWIGGALGRNVKPILAGVCKSFVLVTRPIVNGTAIGIPGQFKYDDRDAIIKKDFRFLFITPWRNTSLIGTFETSYHDEPEALTVGEQEIRAALHAINLAFPAAQLRRDDVLFVLRGIVPSERWSGSDEQAQLQKHHEIRDHAVEDGIEGLISVTGVKYTTARHIAEKTVDKVFTKLGKKSPMCRTAVDHVYGGAIESFELFRERSIEERPRVIDADIAEHLATNYGTANEEIYGYLHRDSSWSSRVTPRSPVIKAEILHGVRAEMAQKLSDVVFRRTELGTAGHPGDDALSTCASIMGTELGWSRQRVGSELEEVQMEFQR